MEQEFGQLLHDRNFARQEAGVLPEHTRLLIMISLTLRPRARAGRRVVARASFHVLFSCAAVAWIAFCSLAPANAANRFWITPAGGAFGSSANWSATGSLPGGATPPAAADVANFTLTTPLTR